MRTMRGHAVPQRTLTTEADCIQLLDQLVNHEQRGIPKDAGAKAGVFDLGRMHRLLADLGDPHKQWPAIHIGGSKGKPLTNISSLHGPQLGTRHHP